MILGLLAADGSLAARIVPDLPYVMAEVVYACRYELAVQLDDILARRLHLNIEGWQRGTGAAPLWRRAWPRNSAGMPPPPPGRSRIIGQA